MSLKIGDVIDLNISIDGHSSTQVEILHIIPEQNLFLINVPCFDGYESSIWVDGKNLQKPEDIKEGDFVFLTERFDFSMPFEKENVFKVIRFGSSPTESRVLIEACLLNVGVSFWWDKDKLLKKQENK